MPKANLFVSYSHEDKPLKESFTPYLDELTKQRDIAIWQDNDLMAGEEWEKKIMDSLSASQVILLLISINFIGSDFCMNREMLTALDMHTRRRALVIPVIISPLPAQPHPFDSLQALPAPAPDGAYMGTRAVTAWSKQDAAWVNVANGINDTLGQALDNLLQDIQRCDIDLRSNRIMDVLMQGDIAKSLDLLIDYCKDFCPNNQTFKIRAYTCKATFISLKNDNRDDYKEREETVSNILLLIDAVRVEPLNATASSSAAQPAITKIAA